LEQIKHNVTDMGCTWGVDHVLVTQTADSLTKHSNYVVYGFLRVSVLPVV